ncbi:hypothetical protein SUGI_1159730 [Cryptomeria japonica]|uniref:probable WRKY transcription factor 3 n=1 Tax=Cryptomeria japonica TaxID=3369 RepID=UPI002414B7CC|nr:probable WRKY transcription factor 3 [Cryptomeria japonica]GLJ54138.1 hypothetical protein SUGI_1159730 [Cryptomeria japonica]
MEGKESEKKKMVVSKPTPCRPSIASAFMREQDPESDCRSFSQLLAGAMAASSSPPPVGNGVTVRPKTVRLKSIPPHQITSSQGEVKEDNCGLAGDGKEKQEEGESAATVVFRPLAKIGTRNPLSSLANLGPFGISHQQALAQVQAQAQGHSPVQSQPASSLAPAIVTYSMPQVLPPTVASPMPVSSYPGFNTHSPKKKMPLKSEMKPTMGSPKSVPQSSEHMQQSLPPIPVGDRPSFDGYNWRKYGQKQVKGSEYPRSYYKCTHPNCPVKKKVERSHDGQVTEIVYKGEHNHSKPQPTRRAPLGTNLHEREMDFPGAVSGDKSEYLEVDVDQSSPRVYADVGGRTERLTTNSDPSTSVRGPGNGNGSPEQSFCLSDDGEDGSRAEDEDDDEPDSKRRKKDKKIKDLLAPQRTSREPRVIVQTTEADILEDGFRWRKYGQKVVKGNPYPRSYYKCTSVKCMVRKHVERASDDPKAVITTYEGKHNHDAPLARNSSQDGAGSNTRLLTGKGIDPLPDKQIQYRIPSYARVSERTAEGEERLHVGEVGGVPMTGNNMQSHGGDMERAFASDDNFAVSGTMQGIGTEANRRI